MKVVTPQITWCYEKKLSKSFKVHNVLMKFDNKCTQKKILKHIMYIRLVFSHVLDIKLPEKKSEKISRRKKSIEREARRENVDEIQTIEQEEIRQ